MLLAQPSAACSVVPANAFLPRCTCHALRAAQARRQQGFKHSAAFSSATHSALAQAHTTLAVSESTMHRLADGMQLEVVRERADEVRRQATSKAVQASLAHLLQRGRSDGPSASYTVLHLLYLS